MHYRYSDTTSPNFSGFDMGTFTVTERTIKQWKNGKLGKVPCCEVCDEEFEVGDRVKSSYTRFNSGAKRRHDRCLVTVPA